MFFQVFIAVLIGVTGTLLHLLWKRYKNLQVREKVGIPGPKADILFGNLGQLIKTKNQVGYDNCYEEHLKFHDEYGPIFGLYVGTQFQIQISDEEMIKEIFIKQFNNFSDRTIPGIFEVNELNESLLQQTRQNGWKEVRSTISPTFSNGKMKAMHEEIKDKISIFLEILEEKSADGDIPDIYDDFQALTLDVIGKCAFAIECNSQRDRSDLFYEQARRFFRVIDLRQSPLVTLSFILPEFNFIWKQLYRFSNMSKAEKPLIGGLDEVYDRRRNGEGDESVDLLKLLLNREDGSEKSLSKRQVVENCFAFLLAGYETTSTALTYCTDLLARHPAVQQKLYEEIVETREKKGLNFDSIHAMKYLDAVFKESLRVYPPVIHFSNRICLKDTYVKGQLIPKGATISVVPYTVHMNENNWERAREFIPERFLDWNDKSSLKWIPFGVGPRYCVGMRFAEMEFKMTLARVVEKFQIRKADGYKTMIPDVQGVIMRPKDAVSIKLKIRPENTGRHSA